MQEEVRDKSVALVIRVGKTGGKLTEALLKAAIRKYLAEQARQIRHGKQTVKELVGQGAGVQSIEVTDKNIGSFERAARKYGVDFAVRKNPSQGKYLVFFKARDADALNAAFAEYTARALGKQKEKPSLQKQLTHFRQVAQELSNDKEKNREKGGMER
ncbi:MAG: PcfB family protein [Roseburia sp.]|nr:PcfB family protein [Roseburia sp.]MCM1096750.1 PcfB family protein [Ruminococcus flavefaciens]MCM1222770.1 PcfB family protein [Lachnospiraceae bacterium]